MFRVPLGLLFAAALVAQEPADLFRKAPPAVDEALRARITKFYQLHVDGKFRQAEELVAEESKDFFYAVNKPKYLGFEIRDIQYTDNFTKAKATIVGKMILLLPGFTDKPVPVPFPSRWELVNGQWYWYVDMNEVNHTPFGNMKPGTAGASGPGLTMPSQADMAKMLNGVKADKAGVTLKAAEASSDRVTITNQLQGSVTLSVEMPQVAGLSAKLSTETLKAGETAQLSIAWKPGSAAPKAPVGIGVRVHPTNQLVPVRVTLQP